MRKAPRKIKVLFLCMGNSCRSQMAEGWAHALQSEVIEPYSAGLERQRMNVRAIKVMAEAGVDITRQHSKSLEELENVRPDYVVTMCENTAMRLAAHLQNARHVHLQFDDPPLLAISARTEEEALGHYRRVRDQIRAFVEALPAVLEKKADLS